MAIKLSDTKTTDKIVRQKLIETLYEQPGISGVIEEFEVARGKARADVVSIIGNKVHAFEIKSDVDTLLRLPNQVRHYNDIFSTITLVVGENHVVEALYEIPDWWGVVVAHYDNSGVSLNTVRYAKNNPAISFEAVTGLLRKHELINILGESQPGCSYWRMSKKKLLDEVKRDIQHDTILDQLSSALLSRKGCGFSSLEVAF